MSKTAIKEKPTVLQEIVSEDVKMEEEDEVEERPVVHEAEEEDPQKLYCICKKPYDASK